MRILHVAEPEAWAARTDVYVNADLEAEGFIHCSTEKQLAGVVDAFYKGRTGLILLTIDQTALGETLIYEDLDDMGEEFPHVYGPIPVGAVVETRSFSAP